jgi:enolase
LYGYIRKISKTRISSLPVPSFNVINGGKHAKNALGFQEFMIFPKGARNFKEAMAMGAEVYKELKNIIKKKYGLNSINIGDEGGFAPLIESPREALELLNKAIKNCNYAGRISINIDCAASEFYSKKNKNYNINFKSKFPFIKSGNEMIGFYKGLLKDYNITSIEDPFMQEDWSSFSELTKSVGAKVQIVGDDLLATNPLRIKEAIEKKACNALLLKINQIGSITESINAANFAKNAGFSVMVSHRSGETSDDFIADLSVGIDSRQIKSGAPFKSERMRKYKRLIKIEQESSLRFAGKNFR